MFGAVTKTWFAKTHNIDPKDIFVRLHHAVRRKKSECTLPTMRGEDGIPDVDVMHHHARAGHYAPREPHFPRPLPEESSTPRLGSGTGAAVVFGATGGFVANGSKNVEIETSTGVYLRHAIQTHFVEIGEDYIELVNRYVKPLYEEGDLLSISEKIIALCQKRVVYRKDMKISWLAKFLSRFAIQHNSAGIGVGEVCKMQFAIDECGAWKVLWGAICAGFGKLVGKKGVFLQGLRTRGGRHRRSD